MEIRSLHLSGAALIETMSIKDHRGSFARLFCRKELSDIFGARQIVNINQSFTRRAGAIRGLHFQWYPHQEMKFVRCMKGAIYDVIVDIRPESPTYLQWHAEILSSIKMNMICAPEGFAHGFQSLEDNCEIIYFTTTRYCPDHEGGMRYDDPSLAIDWPMEVSDISEKDMSHPFVKRPGDQYNDSL